jgi:protoheme IX farnesyltransferase
MLPVVAGPEETKRQILLYSIALVVTSVLLSVWGGAGLIYLGSAVVLGAGFVVLAVRLWRDGSVKSSTALFRYSIVYLALLFAAIAVDGLAG